MSALGRPGASVSPILRERIGQCRIGRALLRVNSKNIGLTPGPDHNAGLRSEDFWIPEWCPVLKDLWYHQGALGREYYLRARSR